MDFLCPPPRFSPAPFSVALLLSSGPIFVLACRTGQNVFPYTCAAAYLFWFMTCEFSFEMYFASSFQSCSTHGDSRPAPPYYSKHGHPFSLCENPLYPRDVSSGSYSPLPREALFQLLQFLLCKLRRALLFSKELPFPPSPPILRRKASVA